MSNIIRDHRSSDFKLIYLVACQAQAISDYLADTNDPSNQRISATGSSLPPLTGPFESRRTETSMLVSASGCGSSTGGLPGLSSGGSVGSLEGSISSKIGADQLSRSTSRLLSQVDGGGLLVLPRRLVEEPIFECPFYFVECNRTFTDEDEWFEHSLAHFKEVGPPTSNECPFCDRHNGRFTHPEPMESWVRRMRYVSSHHQRGETVGTARPDFSLITYLWENNLMDKTQYRNLRCRSESQTSPYTVTESRRSRHRRRWNPTWKSTNDERILNSREYEEYDDAGQKNRTRTTCYFLLHRKSWMDIGQRNSQKIRDSKNFRSRVFFHFVIKEREVSPYVLAPLAYSHVSESKGLQRQSWGPWPAFGCTDQRFHFEGVSDPNNFILYGKSVFLSSFKKPRCGGVAII